LRFFRTLVEEEEEEDCPLALLLVDIIIQVHSSVDSSVSFPVYWIQNESSSLVPKPLLPEVAWGRG